MSELRIVKKYPNRRLYDTEESRYITLADIRRLVLEEIDFVVVDKNSQKDITRNILLQVISEQEQSGNPIMSRDFLSQVIRSYGDNMQAFVATYLEQSLKLLDSQQRQLRQNLKEAVGTDPIDLITDVTRKNFARWKAVQEKVLRILSEAPPERPESDSNDDDSDKSR